MAKKQNNKREQLERNLGQLAYQIGKKQTVMNQLNRELQALQGQANELATQLEKLDEQ